MKIRADVFMNLRTKEVINQVNRATKKALRDVITDIANAVIKGSPHITGHNRLGGKVTRTGKSRAKEPPFTDWQPELKELEGAVYSTSGYGGYLETGTVNMPAQPYFKPALDRNIHKLPAGIKAELK